MSRRIMAITLFILFYSSASLQAATLVVPTQYSTIQGAINAALPNDTVQVLAGEYIELIQIHRKDLNLITSEKAVLNGRHGGYGVDILDCSVNVVGFTFTNSQNHIIHAVGTNVPVRHSLTIAYCSVVSLGGPNAAFTTEHYDLTFTHNSMFDVPLQIINCNNVDNVIIDQNYFQNCRGSMHFSVSNDPTMTSFKAGTSLTVQNNRGINLSGFSIYGRWFEIVTFTSNEFNGLQPNPAYWTGITLFSCDGFFVSNCKFSNHPGFEISTNDVRIIEVCNNSFAGNSARISGVAMFTPYVSQQFLLANYEVRNNIFFNNSITQLVRTGAPPVSIEHNDIHRSGLPASAYSATNIDVDPRWVDSSHHLGYNSPLKTAGDPQYGPSTDMEGHARAPGTAPIGPDVFAPVLYAIDTNADGSVNRGGMFKLRAVMDPNTFAALFAGPASMPLTSYLLGAMADPVTGYVNLLNYLVPMNIDRRVPIGFQLAMLSGNVVSLSNPVFLMVR